MRIFPVLRRVVNVISDLINFRFAVDPATRVQTVATLLVPERPASSVSLAPATLLVTERPASAVSTVNTGSVRADTAPGASVSTVNAGTLAKPLVRDGSAAQLLASGTVLAGESPAGNMVQIQWDLNHASHVVSSAQDAGGTGTWNSPSNLNGAPQSTRAGSSTFNGGLVLGTGRLRGTMVAQNNRPSTLAIVSVHLDFYGETTGLPVVSDLISQLQIGYRINTSPLPAADRDLETLTSNQDFLTTPKSFRIDNGAGAFTDLTGTPVTWANVRLIQPYFNATTIANGLMTYYADAVRLRVVATETQAL